MKKLVFSLLLLLLFSFVINAQSATCTNNDLLVIDTSTKTYKCITPNLQPAGTGTTMLVANASSTGTTANRLAKLTGAPSTAVITSTSDTENAMGIVTSGAGTTGNAIITILGQATCDFDNATTAGNYFVISAITAGKCHDAGSSFPTDKAAYGKVLSTNGSSGSYVVQLMTPDIAFQNGGNGKSRPGGSNFSTQYANSNVFAGAGPGTVGQVFTSNGASSAPTFNDQIPTSANIVCPGCNFTQFIAQWKVSNSNGSSTVIGQNSRNLAGAATDLSDTDGIYNNHQASGGLPTAFNRPASSTYNLTRFSYRPIFAAGIKTGASSAGTRIWIGLVSGVPSASDTPSVHIVAFRYSTNASDTTWKCVTDNGSGSPTVTNSGVTFSINTPYRMAIVTSASDAKFYINNALVCTNAATLPTGSQLLGDEFSIVELDGGTKNLYFNYLIIANP